MVVQQNMGGFALICDDSGIIHEVIRDDLGLDQLAHGQPIVTLVHASERVKLLNFLVDLRRKRAVFNWEINLLKKGLISTLYMSGFELADRLVIVGAETHSLTLKMLDELFEINNEQANALRKAMHVSEHSATQNEKDYSLYNEISRLNNELVTLQRDLAKKNMELERLYAEVKSLSTRDPLTGVYNRRGLFELGEQELKHAWRYHHPLSGIVFDFDRFKFINDGYGHAVGDQVLVETVLRVRSQLRKVDILGRYGGDEFFILLPETPLPDAHHTAERIRAVAAKPIRVKDCNLSITISLGIAALAGQNDDLDALLLRADQALYRAKAQGGNCACCEAGDPNLG